MRRGLAWLVLAVAGVPALYVTAALIGGAIAVNRGFVPTPVERGGVPVYVRTNGVHADLVVPAAWPASDAAMQSMLDWSQEFPVEQIIAAALAPARAWNWIAFGWGDRGFYLNTPRWRDLRPTTAWIALTGQGTGAMHVEYLDVPERYLVRRVDIGPEQYRRLVAFIRSGFVRDRAGAPLKISHPGFGATDAFFEGVGSYTLWLTSNEWVRNALDHAGIRTAWWAPFDAPLYWHLAGGMPRTEEAVTIHLPTARPVRATKETR